MATRTVTTVNHSAGVLDLSTAAVAVDVAGSDKWANTGNEQVYVENNSGSSLTVTENFGPNGKVDGIAPASPTKIVAAGKRALLGPYPQGPYNDANGFMNLSWSATTTIKMLVFLKGS